MALDLAAAADRRQQNLVNTSVFELVLFASMACGHAIYRVAARHYVNPKLHLRKWGGLSPPPGLRLIPCYLSFTPLLSQVKLEAMAIRLEAMAIRLEAMAVRSEANAIRL